MKQATFKMLSFSLIAAIGCNSTKYTHEAIVNTFQIPSQWQSALKYSKTYDSDLANNLLAEWILTDKVKTSRKIVFQIYKYEHSDSLKFIHADAEQRMMASCFNTETTNLGEQLTSFRTNDYYFMLNMCSCSTQSDESCRIVATALQNWITFNRSAYGMQAVRNVWSEYK